jgi:hypothetical protein
MNFRAASIPLQGEREADMEEVNHFPSRLANFWRTVDQGTYEEFATIAAPDESSQLTQNRQLTQ